jgi:hypothetical protein
MEIQQVGEVGDGAVDPLDEDEGIEFDAVTNPRERRRKGGELLASTLDMYRQMHGFND